MSRRRIVLIDRFANRPATEMGEVLRSSVVTRFREVEMDRRRGYTLMETVVSIAIIAVLFGLLFCAVMQSRASAARSECAHHLRQIGIALHLYHEGHSAFPPGCSYEGGDSPQPFMSWSARILPFLEQSSLWDQALEAYAQQPNFTLPPHPI